LGQLASYEVVQPAAKPEPAAEPEPTTEPAAAAEPSPSVVPDQGPEPAPARRRYPTPILGIQWLGTNKGMLLKDRLAIHRDRIGAERVAA
jgi:hypothetical protein